MPASVTGGGGCAYYFSFHASGAHCLHDCCPRRGGHEFRNRPYDGQEFTAAVEEFVFRKEHPCRRKRNTRQLNITTTRRRHMKTPRITIVKRRTITTMATTKRRKSTPIRRRAIVRM